MPGSSGSVSGADSGAVRPSKIPRTPPNDSPNTHFFMATSGTWFATRPFYSPRRRIPLDASENQEQNSHQQVGGDQGENRSVVSGQAPCGPQPPLGVGHYPRAGQKRGDIRS